MAGKGKTLPGETRKLVFNLIQFALREKESKKPAIELHKAMDRVSAMTGISRDTLSRIKKEGAVNNGVWKTPYTIRTGRPKKIVLDESLRTVIKNKINEFYSKNEVPSLRKLLRVLKEDNNFAASVDTLRRVLNEMGFKYTTTSDSKKKVLTECGDGVEKKSQVIKKSRAVPKKDKEDMNTSVAEKNLNNIQPKTVDAPHTQPTFDPFSGLWPYAPIEGRPMPTSDIQIQCCNNGCY